MAMITVPITDNYDQAKILGSVTIEEDALIDSDLVLAIGGKVLERNGEEIRQFKVLQFGLIHVMQHAGRCG